MFNKTLNETPLTTRLANGFFDKFPGNTYRDDTSFTATIRALLYGKTGDDVVNFRFRFHDMSAGRVKEMTADQFFFDVVPSFDEPVDKGIYLIAFDNSSDEMFGAVSEKLDHASEGMEAKREGFRELLDLKTFMAQVLKARFFINEEAQVTIIFAFGMDMRKYHFLQAVVPRYLPWYFKGRKLTDLEKRLLKGLTSRYSNDYESALGEIMEGIDLRDYTVKSIIGDFEKNSRSEQFNVAKRNVDNIHRRMNENVNQYKDLLEQLDAANVTVAGLLAMMNSGEGESELLDFFLHNKMLTPVRAEGSRIEFIVKCYLDTFDPEMYATMAANKHSHLYHGYTVARTEFNSADVRKRFMDAIFGEDATLKIKCCAYYSMDIRGEVDSSRGYRFPPAYKDHMPNPHLNHYDCLGNHRQFINECLKRGDTVGAVSQCMSSARSLNIGESTTMEKFLRDLFQTDAKIIEMPDGSSATTLEALSWLNNNGEKK